ncbi:uncharacterized protein Tco025E_04606 [Trypanosoma conorhini]|uniref:Uncharacterized protein n=1 Tax=Trypanosoma conorhini TaxID=83891 RepID=A0A422PKA7_9TRYP|nr:uncharacterized protein Tco025E_04606 [Trypanosoma conorhini]RNF18148.1 hypothetical protein Tco025E_04606 [Trypanosoma conorhini]
MMFEKLPLAPYIDTSTVLQDTVENVLASSHSLLNTTRRLSDAGVNDASFLEDESFAGQLPRAAHRGSVSESFGATIGIFQSQLEECRDVLRMVDSERRFYREKALEMQNTLGEESKEVKHLRLQIAESQRELRKAQRSAMGAQKKMREMEAALASATEEQMHLRRYLRAMPRDQEELLLLVPDRRFEEAFRDKMCAIKYKRLYNRARELHEQGSERMERSRMAMEDNFLEKPTLEDLAASLGSTQLSESLMFLNMSSLAGASNSLSSSQRLFTGGARELVKFPFQLPFTHVTPRDGYIKTQIQRSAYAEPLRRFREGFVRLTHLLKRTQDVGVRNMYAVMLESLRTGVAASSPILPDPMKAFEAAIEKVQGSHRDLLYELLELANSSVLMLVENEAQVNKKPSLSRRDVGCGEYLTTPLDMRIASLETRLETQRRKSASDVTGALLGNFQVKTNYTEMRRKTKTTLQQLLTLHAALQQTVQAVQAHCLLNEAKPNDVFADLFIAASDAAVEDPRYETKVAEAVEADLQQAAQLGDSLLQAAKLATAPDKEKGKPRKTTGVSLRKRQLERQQGSRPVPFPQGNGVESRKSIGSLNETRSASSKRGSVLPRGFSGAGSSDNPVVARNSVAEARDSEALKAATKLSLGAAVGPNPGGRSKGAPAPPVYKARSSFSKQDRLPGAQNLVQPGLSKVSLPQFMLSEGEQQ